MQGHNGHKGCTNEHDVRTASFVVPLLVLLVTLYLLSTLLVTHTQFTS